MRAADLRWDVLGIRGLNMPEPADAEFVARVRELIAQADREVWQLLGRVAGPIEPGRPGRSGASCVACGCPADEATIGCRRCRSRHEMRRFQGVRHIDPRRLGTRRLLDPPAVCLAASAEAS